ncbi:hypothetical protein [Paenibacillus odorifer]|nr:hypothetical protein [Paenibacillus odorifer]
MMEIRKKDVVISVTGATEQQEVVASVNDNKEKLLNQMKLKKEKLSIQKV